MIGHTLDPWVCHRHTIFRVSRALRTRVGEYVGLEEIADGIWNVYFGPLRLGRLNERHLGIEDQYGRLYRRS